MTRISRTRPLAPTHALDHALDALAANDADNALRWAVPALADVGSGAAAADIVGRALTLCGRKELALDAHRLALSLLIQQALVPHAVAAGLALHALEGNDHAIRTVAKAFGAESVRGAGVPPPPLKSEAVQPLEKDLPRDRLIGRAVAALTNTPKPDGTSPQTPRLPLWGALPVAAFVRFAQALRVHVLAPGAKLMTEGEPGDRAFVLARGEVRVTRNEPDGGEYELAVLGPGSIVGEMALVTDAARAATVTSTRGALVLEAPRTALDDAARDVPAVGEQVLSFCHRRLVDNVMRTSVILREVPATEREGLAQLFRTRTFEAGERLLVEGEPTSGLHLIAAGAVDVLGHDPSGEATRIATLGPGSCVGEIGLVMRRPATASVIATSPTVSLELAADQFLATIKDRPNLLARLYELAVRREDETLSVVAQEAEEIDDAILV